MPRGSEADNNIAIKNALGDRPCYLVPAPVVRIGGGCHKNNIYVRKSRTSC